MDLKRRGLQDLVFIVFTIESVTELKKEFLKGQSKKMGSSGKDEGDQDKSPSHDKPSIPKDKVKGKKG